MKSTIMRVLAAAALLQLPGTAAAAPQGEGPLRPGWYVAPMVTYVLPDSARCNVDGGPGASVALGHRGAIASLELWGQFLSLDHGGCTYTVPAPTMTDPDNRDTVTEPPGTVELNGGGLALVAGPFFEGPVLSRFFALLGVGVLRREGHPQYPEDDSTMFGDAGVGYMHPLTLFGLDTRLRVEARYRYEIQQPPYPDEQDPAPPHAFEDIVFNAGLQFALSPRLERVPDAVPEAVAVVTVDDADGDGVTDDRDSCPGTPAGQRVDDTGCAVASASLGAARAGDTIVLEGVTFESASAVLTGDARTLLDGVAKDLAARPALRVEIAGHTDSTGDDAYNQWLSEERARAVLRYLVEQGVGAGRLTAVGYGEARPIADNTTHDGRQRNRRVELKVME